MTYYEVLEVAPNASDDVILIAYKTLVQKYNLENFVGDKAFAERRMAITQKAYRILSDPELRKKYDQYLLDQSSPTSSRGMNEKKARGTNRTSYIRPIVIALLCLGVLAIVIAIQDPDAFKDYFKSPIAEENTFSDYSILETSSVSTDFSSENETVFSDSYASMQETHIEPEPTYAVQDVQSNYGTTFNTLPTEPVVPEPPSSSVMGYVIESSGGLKIRSGPGTSYQEVGRLAPNEQVTIYEQIYGESYMWGKIDRGWVCMDYIAIGTAPKYKEVHEIGYIIGSEDGVNLRSGPATSYAQIGKVPLGKQVVVTKLHHNGVSEWGYIGTGWICTDYIHFGDAPVGTDYYENSGPASSDRGGSEPAVVCYDCYGNELQVGYYVCIGASKETSEFAVGTIIALEDGVPVVKFTELYDYDYPGGIMYCMDDLADKINYFGYYCDEIESQYLLNFYYG